MQHFVLWVVIISGSAITITHQRFESREACEQSAVALRNVPSIRRKLVSAEKGYTTFTFDHVCSGGAAEHQGGD